MVAAIAPLGLALSAIGTVAGVAGQVGSAEAEQKQASYQAEVARNNQIIAAQNAQYASQAGASQVTASQLKQRQDTGEVAAELASSGLDINTGTPASLRTAATELGQLSTAGVAENAALQVYGYKTQGTSYGAQAGLYQQEATEAPLVGAIAGGSSLLSGVGGLASKWSEWQLESGNLAGTGGWSGSTLVPY